MSRFASWCQICVFLQRKQNTCRKAYSEIRFTKPKLIKSKSLMKAQKSDQGNIFLSNIILCLITNKILVHREMCGTWFGKICQRMRIRQRGRYMLQFSGVSERERCLLSSNGVWLLGHKTCKPLSTKGEELNFSTEFFCLLHSPLPLKWKNGLGLVPYLNKTTIHPEGESVNNKIVDYALEIFEWKQLNELNWINVGPVTDQYTLYISVLKYLLCTLLCADHMW